MGASLLAGTLKLLKRRVLQHDHFRPTLGKSMAASRRPAGIGLDHDAVRPRTVPYRSRPESSHPAALASTAISPRPVVAAAAGRMTGSAGPRYFDRGICR